MRHSASEAKGCTAEPFAFVERRKGFVMRDAISAFERKTRFFKETLQAAQIQIEPYGLKRNVSGELIHKKINRGQIVSEVSDRADEPWECLQGRGTLPLFCG